MTPLILLAAGRSTRFGALKQVAAMGPGGASILAYTIVDALLSGFGEIVLVVRAEIESAVLEHVGAHLGPGLPIRTVHQDEPLGTAHAALLALETIDGAAGLANGDDAYGRAALRTCVAACARVEDAATPPSHAVIVGYRMAGTLSDHGGVSRGAIEADPTGRVTSLREIVEVRRGEDGRALHGRTLSGDPVTLPVEVPASMNLWALGPGLVAPLREAFARWRGEREAGGAGEFVLSGELEALRRAGRLDIHLTDPADGWFGVTFPEDTEGVRERLEAKHAEGEYHLPLAKMMDPFRSA